MQDSYQIGSFPSSTKASKASTMIAAYDSKTGKIAVGVSNGKVVVEDLDPKTVVFNQERLGV